MLINTGKRTKFAHNRFIVIPFPSILSSISFLSSLTPKHQPEAVDRSNALRVSALLKNPSWEQSSLLKSLVSHMTPDVASQVILLQNDTALGVRFFKWVCKQSTYCYDLDSRIHLLNLLVSSNLFGVAHKAVLQLVKDCSNSDRENDILKLMGALDELREVGFRLSYPCYSRLLMSLAKLDLGFEVYMVYKRMAIDGFLCGAIDYRTIINALCKNELVQAGKMFLSRMLKLGFSLDSHICTSLVLGHCRGNDLEEAFKVFELMSQEDCCRPNSVTYTTLIHGLCEVGRLHEAFSLKDEMREKGCEPGTRTYTVLIKALCDFGLTNKSLCLLDEMVAIGCKPNVHTYTVLVDGLCREGMIDEANRIFRKMIQEGLFPSTVSYNALINGYCKKGRVVAAFELLAMMEKRNCRPTIRTYNELMEGLCEIKESHKALLVMEKIVDNGLCPDEVTFNILVSGFCKEGKLDMALKIFNSMSLFSLVPDTYTFTEMIDGLCKSGRPELANKFFSLMLKKGITPDEVTFTALIDGHCKSGKTGEALMIFERMIENPSLRISHALNSFLDMFSKENRLKKEFTIFAKFLKYGLVPSVTTYTILIYGFCQGGDIASALNTIELMMSAGCPPNLYAYTVIIHGMCQSGRVKEAHMLLFKMFNLGLSPSHVTYTILVKAHIASGKLDEAVKILRIMVINGCQLNSCICLAILAGLNATSLSLEQNDDNESVCGDLLSELDIENAFALRDMIERCGGSTEDFYNFLVVTLCRAGRISEAENIVKDTLKHGLFAKKAIDFMIERYHKRRKYDNCIELIRLVLHYGFSPSFASYTSVIHGLYNEGRSEQAQRLVSDILTYNGVEEDARGLAHIEFLLKGDNPVKCHKILHLVEQLNFREKPVI